MYHQTCKIKVFIMTSSVISLLLLLIQIYLLTFILGSLWWKNFEQNSKYVRTTQANPFSCQHCGKRYRWKSTLKRHEVFECGGKEPVHRCPHCEYRAKQSGNLRVHIRKYHTALE